MRLLCVINAHHNFFIIFWLPAFEMIAFVVVILPKGQFNNQSRKSIVHLLETFKIPINQPLSFVRFFDLFNAFPASFQAASNYFWTVKHSVPFSPFVPVA